MYLHNVEIKNLKFKKRTFKKVQSAGPAANENKIVVRRIKSQIN